MKRRISLLSLGLALALVASARDEFTRDFDKTVQVRTGAKIWIENKFGDVVVRSHAQQDVIIHAAIRVSASDSSLAKQYADRVEIFVQPASDLAIRTHYPEAREWSNFGGRDVSFSVHYEIMVP